MSACKIRINEDERGYQAQCACNKYRSRWQEYRGAAIQLGRVHVERVKKS